MTKLAAAEPGALIESSVDARRERSAGGERRAERVPTSRRNDRDEGRHVATIHTRRTLAVRRRAAASRISSPRKLRRTRRPLARRPPRGWYSRHRSPTPPPKRHARLSLLQGLLLAVAALSVPSPPDCGPKCCAYLARKGHLSKEQVANLSQAVLQLAARRARDLEAKKMHRFDEERPPVVDSRLSRRRAPCLRSRCATRAAQRATVPASAAAADLRLWQALRAPCPPMRTWLMPSSSWLRMFNARRSLAMRGAAHGG